MVTKATRTAASWINEVYSGVETIQSGNMCTDKKTSFVNTLLTRGKRVVAEATVVDRHLREIMRCSVKELYELKNRSALGAFAAGSNNNGSHSVNAIAAIFIATGQDVANAAES